VCGAEVPSQKEIQSFHVFSQEYLCAGDEYKAAQVVEAFVGDRIKALEDAEPEDVASILKPYGGDVLKYAEDEAKRMNVRTRVMRSEDDSRKYRVRNAITYNPPPSVGEVQVCLLYFIHIQCFPYHKLCDMENEYFAGGNCETRGMLSACYIYNQCFPCRNVCDMENDEFQCFPCRNVCDMENDEFV
jgi:hypothetical protein